MTAIGLPGGTRRRASFSAAKLALRRRFHALRPLHEFLGDVVVAVPPPHDSDSHVRVFRIQNVPTVVVLEPGLVHEGGFRVADARVHGDIFTYRLPGDSRRPQPVARRPAVWINMVEVSSPDHVL